MGNNLQTSRNYTYQSVDDIPPGTSPPSLAELKDKVNEIASISIQKYDPVDLKTCQTCLKMSPSESKDYASSAQTIVNQLSSYSADDRAYAEKTYQFKMEGMPEIWISSTKNSDHTISYWFQYPILPFHVQAAFLYCLNMPITPQNMVDITKRFPGVYAQLLAMTKNEVIKCEQIEPLYVDLAVKSLLRRGYKATVKKINVE
jgi:hypothetical protein